MHSSLTVTLVDGTRVVVPDSLDLITPYVLLEQEDWFEDEIKFLRRILQPGMRVIDIGANHGVYALSMAKAIGPSGGVWAFEPASRTAAFLEQGVAANGFQQVIVDRSALSDATGTARLRISAHSEWNALINGKAGADEASEAVAMSTLDACMDTYRWRDINFVKIDAEGQEINILRGGARFFETQSPLVQYEIKEGNVLHLKLARVFSDIGYASYRLVPGLDLLMPFDADSVDPFLLNLFCCKRDCAATLRAAGFLLDNADTGMKEKSLVGIHEKTRNGGSYDWRKSLVRLPYAARLARHWEQWSCQGALSADEEALACHALSRDASAPAAERFLALETALTLLQKLCKEKQESASRLASLARAAQEYGARAVAVRALNELCNLLLQGRAVISEPFLAPGARFDSIPPGSDLAQWLLAGALEELERLVAYSSFYTGAAAKGRLELIHSLGMGSAEMRRRLDLLQRKSRPRAA